ncbi:MAG TPA: deoxyribodipyrimidine photo-lyase [Miltoncostaeaceae bacterium]|nr:deoxyribodipyrimidine photo-lyase [Miltoncostaeaceae bacterium]
MPPTVLWFRRDLRLDDNPALLAAAEQAGRAGVVALFVLDPALLGPAGPPRRAVLFRCLRALDEATGGRLVVRAGDPTDVVPRTVAEVGAGAVHCAADHGVHGRERDARVEAALAAAGVPLVRLGSPWLVAPGRVTKADGSPFRVYSPYARAWRAHGWRDPAPRAEGVTWLALAGDGVPDDPDLGTTVLPPAGEQAAREAWRAFRDVRLSAYAEGRDRPATPGTSQLSMHLKYGTLHPRTLVADLGESEGEERFRGELAWRDFYADVLWHAPHSAREPLHATVGQIRVDTGPQADARFAAWAEGRTGYPVVDAGMRQLRAEAWVHNRVRMVVASFLVKDLHLDWRRGARHFMRWLRDGELSSNQHGWQWVAGTGTDAAPYFRVFNPTLQGERFDPDGDYVRRYVPELAGVAGKRVHRPWDLPGGPPEGYPRPLVDHAEERREALARLAELD